MAANLKMKHVEGVSIITGANLGQILLDGSRKLRLAKQLSDVTIMTGNKSISAHKLVLASLSPYFMAMFTGKLKETTENTVTIQEVDPLAVETIIDYFYTGTIRIDESTVENLLACSSLFQEETVRLGCAQHLEKNLTPENCVGILSTADKYALDMLVKSTTAFVLDNFEEVAKNEEFLELELEKLIGLISSDSLKVESEEKVYEATMRWIRHSTTDRLIHFSELLAHMRLAHLNPCYLVALDKEPWIRSDEKCRDHLFEAMSQLVMNNKKQDKRQSTIEFASGSDNGVYVDRHRWR